jgi:hypothetical protein
VWQGSPLEGRTILVMCEQGLGDTIQFIRYVALLVARGAKVIVECQGKLRPLLQRLGNTAEGGCGTIQVVARGEALPQFDFHARLMTLPGILGSTPDDLPADVPYLHIEEKRIERMSKKLLGRMTSHSPCPDSASLIAGPVSASPRLPVSPSPRLLVSPSPRPLKIGLVWQGNTSHKGDRFRSIPLAQFAPLAAIPGVQLVSLQKGFGSEQIDQCGAELAVIECSDRSDTTAEALLDTAALIKSLDLVIAVDTAVAHLAGALGMPVWVALPRASDWRWLLDREDSPWYPTMRLFRQRELGDWAEVIERMAEALRRMGEQVPRDEARIEDLCVMSA